MRRRESVESEPARANPAEKEREEMSEHFPGNAPSPAICCHEIANFVDILKLVKPPRLGLRKGDVELYGNSVFLNGAAGGDHIIYVDFEHRYDLERRIDTALAEGRPETAEALAINRDRIGILVADVSGHKMTDALAAAMLHQAFLTGVLYELDRYGEVTTRLFENLNTRFHNSLSFQKYITLIYGEISSNGGFRFLSAGSPPPLVFSAEYDRFVTICPDRTVSFLPLGMAPSEDDVDLSRHLGPLGTKPRYTVNEVNLLGDNDILILHTDGLSELSQDGGASFVPEELEKVIRRAKRLPAEQIYMAIREAATEFAPIEDDMTLLVIKKRKDGG
jgi:serine phosphatase RsbU (regulator of sigma subunit)